MKILTGNDLKSGAVVWWDGGGWSLNVDEAVDVGDQAEVILAAEEAARPAPAPEAAEEEAAAPSAAREEERRFTRPAAAPARWDGAAGRAG